MRIRIVWAALGAWAATMSVGAAAGAAALQSTIDTSGDYAARQAVQTLIDERAPAPVAMPAAEPVEAAGEAVEEAAQAATSDVNELMAEAAQELETAAEEVPAPLSANTPVRQTIAHEFDDCQRPLRPDFELLPSTRARVIRSRQNRVIAQYNDYVAEANAYMRCLAEEAQRDLDAYYKAVSDALDAEQASMMGALETVRKELDDRR